MKIIKTEFQKSDQGRHMKIFNRAIEPNEYSCSLSDKAAIENLPSPLNSECTEFEICCHTFEGYKESQQRQEDSVSRVSINVPGKIEGDSACRIIVYLHHL